MSTGMRTAVDVGVRRLVDHERLARLGLDERTEAGRRHVVGDALAVARAAGVEVVIEGRDAGRYLEPGAIVVEQPPPERFRSNAAWAADLFRNISREYAADPREGANALEALCAGVAFRALDETKLTAALGRAVRHVESGYGQSGEPAALDGGAAAARDRLLRDLAEPRDRRLGDPGSPYAVARAMLRAELEESGPPMLAAIGERPVRLDPAPYGESLGGCVAWHLAETTSRFRCFDPDELARTCEAVAVAQGANELLGHAGLTCTLDAGVGFECGNPDIRMELERHGLAAGELSQLGTLVSGQVLRTTGHPHDPCRPRGNVGVPEVDPVGFRPLDSRWPEAVEPITDRVLSVCVRSGVALTLTDGDRVRVCRDEASGAREDPWPSSRGYSSYARVEHPIPERFETPEAWARSVLEATALAVATHPRLANQVRLDDLTRTCSGVGTPRRQVTAEELFANAAHNVCVQFGLRPGELSHAAAVGGVADSWGTGSFPSLRELEHAGVRVPREEVERRRMWLALERAEAREGEGAARGWQVGEGLESGDRDHAVATRLCRACTPAAVVLAVDGCARSGRSLGEDLWDEPRAGWRPGQRPSADAVRQVDRSIASLAADRILERLGVAGERLDFEIPRAGSRTEAFTKRLPAIQGVDVALEVRRRASEVVEFMRDEDRAMRWDRRGDVLHSAGNNPWNDLERLRSFPVAHDREARESELEGRAVLPARREAPEARDRPRGEPDEALRELGRSGQAVNPAAAGSRRRGAQVER